MVSRVGRRIVAVAVAMVTTVIGGCGMSGADEYGHAAVVHDGTVVVDLRHPPSRDDVGFPPGRNHTGFDSHFDGFGDTVPTTITLPTGTVHIPADGVVVTTKDLSVARRPQPPSEILVERLCHTPEEAAAALRADAPVLGLDPAMLDLTLGRVGPTVGTRMPQQGVLDGYAHGWLYVYVEVIGYEENEVGLNYHFTIGTVHNPATDRVVHDGVYALDLTHRPSREELGYLPYSDFGDIGHLYNETLRLRLTVPGGTVEHPLDSVTSGGRTTDVDLGSMFPADVRRALLADTPVFGLDPAAVQRVLDQGTPREIELPGRSTPVYDVRVKVSLDVNRTDRFAASLGYAFTYH